MHQGEKTLRELGLTSSQARVYLTLVKLGNYSTVKTINDFSKVARQDVYRTLTELRDFSLVEMVIGNPAMFRAIPLQETITILVERKNQKTCVLMAEATKLLSLLSKEKETECSTRESSVYFDSKKRSPHSPNTNSHRKYRKNHSNRCSLA